MIKRKRIVFAMLPMILILAACASLKLPGTTPSTGTSAQQGQNQQGQPFDMSNQPVEQILAVGTLKLEGTDKAITAEQAKALLPLWKAVRSLSRDSKTTTAEIDAVYKQIQETMTPEQVQAIKDLRLTQADTQALIKQYGVQMPQFGSFPTLSPEQQATRQARRSANNGGTNGNGGRNFGGGTGGFPGGGFPPGGAFPPGGGQFNAQGTPGVQRTPRAGQPNGGFRGGMNMLFIDPLVKVLEERAGIQPTPTPQ